MFPHTRHVPIHGGHKSAQLLHQYRFKSLVKGLKSKLIPDVHNMPNSGNTYLQIKSPHLSYQA